MRRNAATRGGNLDYRAIAAQWHADRAARRPRPGKLAGNPALRAYVERRLAGQVTNVDGAGFAGPKVIWKKRRAVLRQSRRWSTAWSPEQIAHRLRIDYPEDPTMRISHEAIYQSLYIQGRGALRRELTACLRSGRALRVPRERTRGRGKAFLGDAIMISERPPAVEDRAISGHWEGDLILGLHSSAIDTLVERSSRFTMLLHLPRQEGYQRGQRVKNGPPLAGHGAEAVRTAIVHSMNELPGTLRRSLTWDQGAEMAQYARLRIESGLEIYFCDPQSPWQRGSNENTNGLLRQYFPKRHRSQPALNPGIGRCRSRDEHAASQNAWMENTDRGARSVPRSIVQCSCCDDRLNPPCEPRSVWWIQPGGGPRSFQWLCAGRPASA